MLNKETLRYRIDGQRIQPTFIKPAGAVLQLAGDLLQFYQQQRGKPRSEINDALTPVLYRGRNLKVSRGLNKLVEDRCAFTEPANKRELREQAFQRSAALLQSPQSDLRAHHKQVAESLGLSARQLYDQLYADLPQAAVLEEACAMSPTALIETYNMAQAQGLLVYADQVEVAIADTDTTLRRQLLKAMRFQRLLADVQQDDAGNLIMRVSGPTAVLDQHQRYGLQLALFLPAIACADDWAVHARVRAPHKEKAGSLQCHLDADSGLRGNNRFIGYVPEEVESLLSRVQKKHSEWRCDDQAPLGVLDQGELLVPDLRIDTGRAEWCIELFHRWHSMPLRRRLQQLAAGQAPKLLIGVDRSLLKRKEFADLADDPILVQRGFLFSGFPSPTALRKCIQAQG